MSGEDVSSTAQEGLKEARGYGAEEIWRLVKQVPVNKLVGRVGTLEKFGMLRGREKLRWMARELKDNQLWVLLSARSDERGRPQGKKGLVAKYHNLIVPWIEELIPFAQQKGFNVEQILRDGEVDELIQLAGDEGYLATLERKPDRGYIEMGASTGSTPSLNGYYEGLKAKQKLQIELDRVLSETGTGDQGWSEYASRVEELIKRQKQEIRDTLLLPREVATITTPSGTDAELLPYALLGIEESAYTDETGSATGKALSGEEISNVSWMGHEGLEGRIKGYEQVKPAKMIKLREQGKPRDYSEILTETEAWLTEVEDSVAEGEKKRVALHVTAGSKTNLGWELGGLRVEDAITLRDRYANQPGRKLEIVIIVDAAQSRQSRADTLWMLDQDLIVNMTGSKYFGGAMFSHLMLVPKKYQEMMREYVRQQGDVPAGLEHYLVQGDLVEILVPEQMRNLLDVPSYVSYLKWATAKPGLEQHIQNTDGVISEATLRFLASDMRQMLASMVEAEASAIINKSALPPAQQYQQLPEMELRWKIKFLEEHGLIRQGSGFEALAPFEIEVDGRAMTEEEIKDIYKIISEHGLHLGQPVDLGGRFVMRFAPSSSELAYMAENPSYRFKLYQEMAKRLVNATEEWFGVKYPEEGMFKLNMLSDRSAEQGRKQPVFKEMLELYDAVTNHTKKPEDVAKEFIALHDKIMMMSDEDRRQLPLRALNALRRMLLPDIQDVDGQFLYDGKEK